MFNPFTTEARFYVLNAIETLKSRTLSVQGRQTPADVTQSVSS